MDIHACESKESEKAAAALTSSIFTTTLPLMFVEMLHTGGFFITGTFMCDKKRLQTVLQAMITPDILLREMMFLNSRFGIIKSCSNKGFKAYTICCIRIRNK